MFASASLYNGAETQTLFPWLKETSPASSLGCISACPGNPARAVLLLSDGCTCFNPVFLLTTPHDQGTRVLESLFI